MRFIRATYKKILKKTGRDRIRIKIKNLGLKQSRILKKKRTTLIWFQEIGGGQNTWEGRRISFKCKFPWNKSAKKVGGQSYNRHTERNRS